MEQVQVILANIERMKCEPEKVLGEILPYYAEKYTRYKREEDARQELVCGILLRKYLGVWKTGQVGYGKDGKPFLTCGEDPENLKCPVGIASLFSCKDMNSKSDMDREFPNGRQWKYNLSHSGVWVALGISDTEIGVDIERIRRYHSATARKLFTEDERTMLEQTKGEDERNALFTMLWTEWEAVLKLEGSGFAGGWRENGVDKDRYAVWTKEMDGYFLSVATKNAAEICLEEEDYSWKRRI